jgi:hypothetical protein
MTYDPRTYAGGRTLEAVSKPLGWLDEKAMDIGEATGGSGDTLGATGVYTAINALPMAFGLRSPKRPRPQRAPSVDQIRQSAQNLYRSADEAGVALRPESMSSLSQRLEAVARKEGLDTRVPAEKLNQHQPAMQVVERLRREVDAAAAGESITLSQLEQLRRSISDVARHNDPGTARIGQKMLTEFDDLVGGLRAGDVAGGVDPRMAVGMLHEARAGWHTMRKHDILDDMWRKAETKADLPSGLEMSLRTDAKRIYADKNQLKKFTKEEQALIKEFALGGSNVERFARFAAGSAPRSMISGYLSYGAGDLIAGPVGGVTAVVGLDLARRGVNAMTRGHYNRLSETVRGGRPYPLGPDPWYGRTAKPGAYWESATNMEENNGVYNGILEER